jgi:hypothetical protein
MATTGRAVSRAMKGEEMREAGRRDQIARGGGSKAATTVGIVLGGVCAVLFVLVVLAFTRASDLGGELDETRAEFVRLSKKTEQLKTDIVAMEGDLRQMRAASAEVTRLRRIVAELQEQKAPPVDEAKIREAVTAALEERRAAMTARFARPRQGGQGPMERIAERMDIDKVEKNVRGLAEAFLEGMKADQKDGEGGDKADDKKLTEGTDKAITEGFDLWRQLREGKITQEEFRRRSRELREKFRKEFGDFEMMFRRGRGGRPAEGAKDKGEGGTF